MVIVVVQLCEVYKVKILSPKVNKQKCDVVYCKKQPCYHCQGENSINYLTNRPRVEKALLMVCFLMEGSHYAVLCESADRKYLEWHKLMLAAEVKEDELKKLQSKCAVGDKRINGAVILKIHIVFMKMHRMI